MTRGRIRLDPLLESVVNVTDSPSVEWETRCRIERREAELEVEQDAA
jgi:hypothetical protein